MVKNLLFGSWDMEIGSNMKDYKKTRRNVRKLQIFKFLCESYMPEEKYFNTNPTNNAL